MLFRAASLLTGLGLVACGALAAPPAKADGNADKGKAVFSQQCLMCHNANSTEKKMGPGLKGVFKKDKLASGKKANEQSIREKIDLGGNGMPPYKDMLSEPEHKDLIAYLKTL